LPERATPSHLGRIPGTHKVNPRLSSAAEGVGNALGSAVSRVRHLPGTLQEAKARFTVIRGGKQQDVRQAAGKAVHRIREATLDVKDQARERFAQARTRTKRLAHDYPLHVIAGAAIFGMLIGIGLRIWRDHAS
jgi:ElaB/YqjD/DUF883 family membrane-anchored ribosome-binding protein